MTADLHTLAGAYALDALPGSERLFFERHLTGCDPCRHEVDEYESTAAVLAAAVAEPPPERVRERVLALVDVTRQLPPLAPPPAHVRLGRHGRLAALLAVVATSLAVGVATLAGVAVELRGQVHALEQQVQRIAARDDVLDVLVAGDVASVRVSGIDARFMFSPRQDRAVLIAEGLAPLPGGAVYELWLWHDGEPRPAQLFAPGADGDAVALVDGGVTGAEQLAVTIEPAGGVPAPTGPVVASATL